MYRFSRRSFDRLAGVRPELVAVAALALERSPVDFAVTEGLRSKERQEVLVSIGASQTYNSRHLTGHAIDVAAWVDGGIRWDWPLYSQIAIAMKSAAADLQIPIVWGGDWTSLQDGPHFELERRSYPA